MSSPPVSSTPSVRRTDFGKQGAVGRRRGRDRNAAGLKDGEIVFDREADGQIVKLDPALFDAGRNENQGRLGHSP